MAGTSFHFPSFRMLPRFTRIQEAVEDLDVPKRTVNQAAAISWALLVPPDGRKRSASFLAGTTGYAEVTVERMLNVLKQVRGFFYSPRGASVPEPLAWIWDENSQDSEEKGADAVIFQKICLDIQRRKGVSMLNAGPGPEIENPLQQIALRRDGGLDEGMHEIDEAMHDIDEGMLDTDEGMPDINEGLNHDDEWEALPVIMSPRRPPSPPMLTGCAVALLRSTRSDLETTFPPVHEAFEELIRAGRSVQEELLLISHLNERNNIPHTTPNIYTDMQQQRLEERLDGFISSFSNATGYTPPTIKSCCPICQTCVTKPVCLDCGHLVCHACITSPYIVDFDGRVKCPMCKSIGQWRKVYPA
jgi:C3HC4-type zinc finger (RING finger) protein